MLIFNNDKKKINRRRYIDFCFLFSFYYFSAKKHCIFYSVSRIANEARIASSKLAWKVAEPSVHQGLRYCDVNDSVTPVTYTYKDLTSTYTLSSRCDYEFSPHIRATCRAFMHMPTMCIFNGSVLIVDNEVYSSPGYAQRRWDWSHGHRTLKSHKR